MDQNGRHFRMFRRYGNIRELGLESNRSLSSCEGEKEKKVPSITYLFWRPVPFSDVLTSLEHLQNLLYCSLLFLEFLHFQALTTSSCLLDELLKSLFHKL